MLWIITSRKNHPLQPLISLYSSRFGLTYPFSKPSPSKPFFRVLHPSGVDIPAPFIMFQTRKHVVRHGLAELTKLDSLSLRVFVPDEPDNGESDGSGGKNDNKSTTRTPTRNCKLKDAKVELEEEEYEEEYEYSEEENEEEESDEEYYKDLRETKDALYEPARRITRRTSQLNSPTTPTSPQRTLSRNTTLNNLSRYNTTNEDELNFVLKMSKLDV